MKYQQVASQNLSKSLKFFHPTIPFLVTTKNEGDSLNIAPFSWGNPVSYSPPKMSLALYNKSPDKSESLKNIKREREYVVNFINKNMTPKLARASFDYPENFNKFDELEFEPVEAKSIETPGIKRAMAHMECEVDFIRKTGDHDLIIADIVAANFIPDNYTEEFILDLNKVSPLIHLDQMSKGNGEFHFVINSDGCAIYDVGK